MGLNLRTPPEPLAIFEILMRENADSLTAFLRAAVDDHAASEDLFQETMLIAWQKLEEYDRNRPFGAWLRGIAKNLVLAYYRSAAREVPCPPEQILEHLDRRLAQIDRQPGDTLTDRIAALTDCLQRLAPAYREPVELHYQQHRTSEWIAQHLATTKAAIQKRLQRARMQLAECLEHKGVLARVEEPV
jgi:RNA polymerase sigma-70 factor (ECF subfamily)